jgi:putative hydrolase of the HAD superfamily
MRYIFFDVDGVLIKGFSANATEQLRWDEHLERDLGIDPDLLQAAFFDRHFADVIVGKKDLLKSLNDILPEVGFKGTAKTLIDYWLKNDSVMNEEVLDIVRQLKQRPGIRLFLATHQEKNRANHLWHELGFKDYFEEIFFSGRMGVRKTDPEFFNKIEKELCFEEGECLLIDDSVAAIEAAKNAGWKTIFYKTPDDIRHLIA